MFLYGDFHRGSDVASTFLSLQNTYYIDSEMPRETTFYQSLLDLFTNLLPNVEPTVREGLPNVYCGLLSVILFVFFCSADGFPFGKAAELRAFRVPVS